MRVLVSRNGVAPSTDRTAVIAASAQIVGHVSIGARCYVDHGVVIASSGPVITLEDGAIVFANSVVRSTGGVSRPAFPVRIGTGSLIAPLCVLTGCDIGENCYVATGAIVLQGARIGADSRIGVGAIVHAKATLPPASRVGFRHLAIPTDEGVLVTPDVVAAHEQLATADFFASVFDEPVGDQAALHRQVHERLLAEVLSWRDEPIETENLES